MSAKLKSIITGSVAVAIVAVVALAIGGRSKPLLPMDTPAVAIVPVEDLGTLADVPGSSPLDARPVAAPAVAGSTEIPPHDPEQTIRCLSVLIGPDSGSSRGFFDGFKDYD